MTTVAYRAGVIAADSLVTCGEISVGSVRKIMARNGVLVGVCGAQALAQGFQDWFAGGMQGHPPLMKNGDMQAEGIIIHPDGTICSWELGGWDRLRADYYAIGSGKWIALGAMAFGASAAEAVQCAIRHDIYSGGEIVTATALSQR